MTDFPVTIYHNPGCGTSRNVLEMIRIAGYEPTVVLYKDVGWTRALLEELFSAAGESPRTFLRERGAPAEDIEKLSGDVSDDVILDAMVRTPILVNRPIVRTPKGVKLCRPSEQVFDLLENRPISFTKEDGEVVTG